MKINIQLRNLRQWLPFTGFFGGVVFLLLGGLATGTTGCEKARLFSSIDTLPDVPAQFHFFNTFSYDTALGFSVDGKLRENVGMYHFSQYYPTSSAFNQDPTQPNGKLVSVFDPQVQSMFLGLSTIQFRPVTSYVVFTSYNAYDTTYQPLNNTVPGLVYYPEDIQTPFDGTSRIRFINVIASANGGSVSMTPNAGAGTTLNLNPAYFGQQPVSAPASYNTTQPGAKVFSMTMSSGSTVAKFTYLPVTLENKNYTLYAVGDLKNFLAGIQPRPRLFLSADGNPADMRELVLSSLTYPGNLSTTSQVTVINDAFNLPGLISLGDPQADFIQYPGIDVQFNQARINLWRWPLISTNTGLFESTYDVDPREMNIYVRTNVNANLAPGAYRMNVVPGNGYTPVYGQFDVTLEQGIAYSLCLLPDATTDKRCSVLLLQNDASPVADQFRLRVINLLSGTAQIDVHRNTVTGPLLASAVPYAQATDYMNLTPTTQPQDLFVTKDGATVPLFQLDATNTLRPISLSFIGGNSGTLYIMGLLPGAPYAGDAPFGPYVIYVSDASVNPNTAQPSQQLFY